MVCPLTAPCGGLYITVIKTVDEGNPVYHKTNHSATVLQPVEPQDCSWP